MQADILKSLFVTRLTWENVVCCNVLQRVQCVAVRCSALQCLQVSSLITGLEKIITSDLHLTFENLYQRPGNHSAPFYCPSALCFPWLWSVSVCVCLFLGFGRFRCLCLCHTIQHRLIVRLRCSCVCFHKRALFSCRRALFSSALETIQHPFIARLQFALYGVCGCVWVCLFLHLSLCRYLCVCLYYIIQHHFISSICIVLSMTLVSAVVARICVDVVARIFVDVVARICVDVVARICVDVVVGTVPLHGVCSTGLRQI